MIEIDKRIKKIGLAIGGFSKKIIKKELRKIQRDLIRGALRNGTKI